MFKIKLKEPQSVFERHQLKIAKDSMKTHCLGLRILGGPSHFEAAQIIHKITGAVVRIEADCTCSR